MTLEGSKHKLVEIGRWILFTIFSSARHRTSHNKQQLNICYVSGTTLGEGDTQFSN